jgi:hypothetical protein
VLHRSSSCMHAVAITPVESQSASFALFLCNISLPRNHGGSASTSRLSRPAQRSLALRPAYSPSHFHDPLHRRLQPFRYLHNCSDCYRLERKLPGGICTRWKTVPLHGAHDKRRYQALKQFAHAFVSRLFLEKQVFHPGEIGNIVAGSSNVGIVRFKRLFKNVESTFKKFPCS